MIFCPNMARQKNSKVGRPRTVDPTGRAAGSRKVATWVTDAQYTQLQRRAAAEGITISELLRQVVMS